MTGWVVLGRSLFSTNTSDEFEVLFYYMFIAVGGALIGLIQTVATLVVMGGASRNFVRHLLHNEPITFRETYRNAKNRLLGLIGISTLISVVLGLLGGGIIYVGLLIGGFGIFFAVVATQYVPFISFIISLVIGIAVTFATLWLFFLVISRFVYIPQIMLVEGQSAFSALNRSVSLAGKNVGRVAMLFIFTFVATYSALAILYIPLGWYAVVEGVDVFSLTETDLTPAWYEIAEQMIWQISLVLLTPIWMIGLCLLYVDERVRKEGYDVELLAARRLGDIPAVPQQYTNPLQPALSKETTSVSKRPAAKRSTNKSNSILGLD